jgi:hypothetical protein
MGSRSEPIIASGPAGWDVDTVVATDGLSEPTRRPGQEPGVTAEAMSVGPNRWERYSAFVSPDGVNMLTVQESRGCRDATKFTGRPQPPPLA